MNSADHVGRCGDFLAPLDALPVLNAVDKFMNPRRASLADRVDALEHREISDRSASCLRRSVDGTTTSTHFRRREERSRERDRRLAAPGR